MTESSQEMCLRCQHTREVHTHLRAGTDCSLCGCAGYRRPSWIGALVGRLLGGRGAGTAPRVALARGLGLLALAMVFTVLNFASFAAADQRGPALAVAPSAQTPQVDGVGSSRARAHDGARLVAGKFKATVHDPPVAVTVVAPRSLSQPPSPTNKVSKPMGIAYGDRLTWMSDQGLRAALNEAVAVHATYIRTDISWFDLQPSSADRFMWSRTDRVLAAARARGLKVLGVVAYTPTWARVRGCLTPTCAPASAAAFATFAGQVAAHYKGAGVAAYEVWNEQNVPAFWTKPDPVAYGTLFARAAKAIKAADPAATVLLGGLASNKGQFGAIRPGPFVRKACVLGRCSAVDAVAYHPYTYPLLASAVTTWHTPWERMALNSPGEESLLTAMTAVGLGAKKVWVTEFGAPTGGPGAVADGSPASLRAVTDHVTEALQSLIVTDGIHTAAKAHLVGGFFLYTDRDAGGGSINSDFYGLRRRDGSAKAAFAAAKTALAAP